tara:strand:+ start:26 stop:196 length:171 start_codon:yes stop_codon:yes gene_type:complete
MVDIVRALLGQNEQKAPARKAKKGKKRKAKQKDNEIADMLKRLADLESKLSSSEEE